jgi:pyruvate/2-oxoglutarate dehydrogenase complex dihydrolipoamide acyltransferase (E2) component
MMKSTKTMEAGTIASWNFSEGDSFEAGSVLAEIETDKATMGFEAQDPGVIAKILVPSGVEVRCLYGAPVSILLTLRVYPLRLRF